MQLSLSSNAKFFRGAKMAQETVRLLIPFEALADSVTGLSLKDKRRLWELLDEQMAQAEEELWERDPAVQAEIQEARSAYQAGDYVTIDEYIAQRRGKAR
jgi:hypothetical protein